MAKQAAPSWKLQDLYTAIDSPAIEKDLKAASQSAQKFRNAYEGKLSDLNGDTLAKAIAEYEKGSEALGKLASYAQLIYAADMSKAEHTRFYQNVSETVTEISSKTLFFTLELNHLDEAKLEKLIKGSKALQKYEPWLRDIRTYKPYQLSEELERVLHEKNITGAAAWVRLFEETISGMRFELGKKTLTNAEILELLSSKKGEVRKEAAGVFAKEMETHSGIFTLITNTLAKDKEIDDKLRGFEKPISSRNLANYVEDEVVDALLKAVKSNYSDLSHRYYKIKAKWLKKSKLEYWDRNAPLPDDDDSRYSWDEARSLVLESYAAFSPELAKIGRTFFDKNWIDAAVRPGKSPGAFAHPTVPSAHPYLLLNFQGKTRDVMTLAHELGHGVHQVLSAGQGQLMADTPLTLAETASVFGEMLVFQEVLKREKNAKRKKLLIASKVEDMLNTVVRQVAFCDFERLIHDERRSGELTADRIGEIWMQVQKESLGPAFKFHLIIMCTGCISRISSIRPFMSTPMRSAIVW
ncbi:MAG: M3 family oligoendopeptidase [Rickettsiales bacterium]